MIMLKESIKREAEMRKDIHNNIMAAYNAQNIFDEGGSGMEICDTCGATLVSALCEKCGLTEEVGCFQCGSPLPPGAKYCVCQEET